MIVLLPGREIFKTSKALVIGISADPVDKQKEFVEKQKLTVRPFTIVRCLHADQDCSTPFSATPMGRLERLIVLVKGCSA